MYTFLIGFVFAVSWCAVADAAVNIEETIAKIQVISAEINLNDAACKEEQNDEEKLIASGYDKLIDEIKQQEKESKGKPLVRDEFETPEEFKQRCNLSQTRVSQLIQQKKDEIYKYRKVKGLECRKKSALLRNELGCMTRKMFLVEPKNVKIEIGKYNLSNETFPFTLEVKNEKFIKLSPLKGIIQLPRDEAKEWKKHWVEGMVHPEISISIGGITTAKLIDKTDDKLLLRFEDGSFMTESARKNMLLKAKMKETFGYYNVECTGSAVEVINGGEAISGGYTYIFIDTGKKKVWAAAPKFYVQLGDFVTLPNSVMPTEMYHDKSLQRTFDLVNFTDEIYVLQKDDTNFSNILEANDMKNIEKADQTVAEIFSGKASLSGKFICVRGKAMKYTPEIFGYNWIRLQDGTGTAGSNELTVTTKGEASQGDILLLCGIVENDRDFGYGYIYPAFIEDAIIVVDDFTGTCGP